MNPAIRSMTYLRPDVVVHLINNGSGLSIWFEQQAFVLEVIEAVVVLAEDAVTLDLLLVDRFQVHPVERA